MIEIMTVPADAYYITPIFSYCISFVLSCLCLDVSVEFHLRSHTHSLSFIGSEILVDMENIVGSRTCCQLHAQHWLTMFLLSVIVFRSHLILKRRTTKQSQKEKENSEHTAIVIFDGLNQIKLYDLNTRELTELLIRVPKFHRTYR